MSDSIVYRCEKFYVEQRRMPDRPDLPFDIVVHPGAAVILPFLPDGRICMIRNWRVSVGRPLLELPAGTLEPPESALACAQRELQEETGYAAAAWQPLLSFYSTPGISTEQMHAFVARELRPAEMQLDPSERITPEPLSLAAALDALRAGEIADAKSIVTLLYFERWSTGR